MEITHHFLIVGRVQGVGYRFFAHRHATRLGLKGFVRNLGDGRVEVMAQGSSGALDEFAKVLQEGPRGSRVDRVTMQVVQVSKSMEEFRITEDGEAGC